jgi:ATP-dependent DNA helicase RecG
VRLHNLREIHFSRNPLIARVMTEMNYMREPGEGVERMIREME